VQERSASVWQLGEARCAGVPPFHEPGSGPITARLRRLGRRLLPHGNVLAALVPPGMRRAAASRHHITYAACVVRSMIVLNTW
jgi:hypothetical protein